MTKQIADLEASDLITDCEGSKESLIFFQKNFIKKVVMILTLSFGKFMSVTDR